MDFHKIVSSLDLSPVIEKRVCPDQYVGRVLEIEAAGGIVLRSSASCRPDENALLLVLESPHIQEFKEQPAPAQGKTGISIAKFLRKVPGLDATTGYPVILINAIQYQCSLGMPTARFRDKVFVAVWKAGGEQDFVARLEALCRPGDMVVCCCTKGNSNDRTAQLRQIVYGAIHDTIPTALILRRTHPAGWNVRKNRIYEWSAV